MKHNTSNISSMTREKVLIALVRKGYWVSNLVKMDAHFESTHFNIVEAGSVKTLHNNYYNWTVYASIIGAEPMERVVRIKHEYFNLVI